MSPDEVCGLRSVVCGLWSELLHQSLVRASGIPPMEAVLSSAWLSGSLPRH